MKLSRVERWILSNQYKILEELCPDDADSYKNARDILDQGYELEYDWIAENIYAEQDCLSEEECSEVINMIDMYDRLQQSAAALGDAHDIDANLLRFPGFDANSESSRLGYCRHFCEGDPDRPRFADLKRTKDWNSHAPRLGMYRRMLEVFKPLAQDGRALLSKRGVLDVLAAQAHPDSPDGRLAAVPLKGPVQ